MFTFSCSCDLFTLSEEASGRPSEFQDPVPAITSWGIPLLSRFDTLEITLQDSSLFVIGGVRSGDIPISDIFMVH